MIKKTTQAIFEDGEYQGTHDWKGGIPLSEGEEVKIHLQSSKELTYTLTSKTVDFFENGDDQDVKIVYRFRLK